MTEFEKIAKRYDRMIWKMVHKNKGYKELDDDDLYQAGLFGLWKATENFDSKKGIAFSTYAHINIEGWMKAEITKTLTNGIKRDEIKILQQIKKEEIDYSAEYDHLFNLSKGIKDIEKTYDLAVYENKVERLTEKEWFNILNEKEREVIVLKYEEGYKNTEISKKMNFSGTYIGKLEKKALKKIREYMTSAA